jgi:hypothetical protein
MSNRDELRQAVALALTGHICGQCECSNNAGWKGRDECECRAAAAAAIAAYEAHQPRAVVTLTREEWVNSLTAALVALAEHGVETDIIELMTHGNERYRLPPGAMDAALRAALGNPMVEGDET